MQVNFLIFNNKKTLSLRKLIKNTFMLSLITPLNGMPAISLIKNFYTVKLLLEAIYENYLD